jgi:hypothetical protein
MNIAARSKGFAMAIAATLSLCSQSCVEHQIGPRVPVSGDYFPTTPGNHWEYVWKYPCWSDTTTSCYDTTVYTVEPVSSWDDKYYFPLATRYGTALWIRKENHAYFSFGAYLPEYKFLDTSIPVDSSWVSGVESAVAWEDFTITEVNAVKVIQGITYRDVIVVRQRQFWKDENGRAEVVRTADHYYARGIGEIYTYYPATSAANQEIEVFLTRFEIR